MKDKDRLYELAGSFAPGIQEDAGDELSARIKEIEKAYADNQIDPEVVKMCNDGTYRNGKLLFTGPPWMVDHPMFFFTILILSPVVYLFAYSSLKWLFVALFS